MKIGKEQMLGLAVALERYLERDADEVATRSSIIVDQLLEGFSSIDSVRTQRLSDEAGRGIERAGIVLEPDMGRALVEHLANGKPPIYPRTHLLNTGIIAFDPRPLERDDVDIIVERVRAFFDER
jgi:seryl-tRNA(Sec) selenium transferase